jgi:hypothetical protein
MVIQNPVLVFATPSLLRTRFKGRDPFFKWRMTEEKLPEGPTLMATDTKGGHFTREILWFVGAL